MMLPAGELERNPIVVLHRRADMAASRDRKRPASARRLLVEGPDGEKEPTKYWLSALSEDAPIGVLVDTAKLLSHGTRLPGTEKRTRCLPFRGAKLARHQP